MCAQVGRYADRRGRIYQKYQYPNCKWNSRVYISHMAVPRKSTQVVNICKPNLLPVTFSFTVLLCSVTGMHKDPLRTMTYEIQATYFGKNSGNPFFYEAASPSPHPHTLLHLCIFKTEVWVTSSTSNPWGPEGTNPMFQSWNIPRRFSLRSGSGRDHRLVFHLECGQCTRPAR